MHVHEEDHARGNPRQRARHEGRGARGPGRGGKCPRGGRAHAGGHGMTTRRRGSAIDIDGLLLAALAEDLGEAGDVTSEATVPVDARSVANLVVREAGFFFVMQKAAYEMPK